MQPLVYILVLNYNAYDDTCSCIESLMQISYNNYCIIIIDNNSFDGSGIQLKQRYKNYDCIHYLQINNNGGYASGNNAGIKYALELGSAEYVCIINNDVVVKEDFLDILINTLLHSPNIAIVGPCICDHLYRKQIQSSGAMMNCYTGEGRNINFEHSVDELIGNKLIECDYVSGACMLFNKHILELIGYLPEDYFLYFEETEWCFKARRAGHIVVCNPDSIVWHKGSASINAVEGVQQYYMDRSRVVFEMRNARKVEYICFLFYLFFQSIWWTLKDINNIKRISHFRDGFKKIINKNFNLSKEYRTNTEKQL